MELERSMTLPEKWRDVPGYEGRYQAAPAGLIRSLRGRKPRLLKTSRHRDGYDKLNLIDHRGMQRTFHVHTIIARTFLGPRPPGQIIDHIDGDHANHAASNLRYVTMVESNKNRKQRAIQSTGEKNIFRHGLGGYYVRVYVSKRLGRYDTLKEAVEARDRFRDSRRTMAEATT